jgi:hypothetical protein
LAILFLTLAIQNAKDNAKQVSAYRPPESDMSKDSPELVESVKNKFNKRRKSNPEDKGFGVNLV